MLMKTSWASRPSTEVLFEGSRTLIMAAKYQCIHLISACFEARITSSKRREHHTKFPNEETALGPHLDPALDASLTRSGLACLLENPQVSRSAEVSRNHPE